MAQQVALVVGARGVIGSGLAEHLNDTGEWDVIGLSRRGGVDAGRVRHLSVDLFDPEALAGIRDELREVTHVFYAAYQHRDGWAELVEPNLTMLRNIVTAVEAAAPGLQHISLLQGYKVYGAHLGPFSTPAREDDPPHLPPEFNVDQQQFLEDAQRGRSWTWSVIRPSVVCGTALGNPMNLAMVIAVYASICKKLGVPLRFPGKPGAYGSLLEMTDAGLLAKAIVWAATNPACANQAFNITNGDLFRWERLWPRIAACFDLEVAPPLPMSLATVMADKESVWQSLITEHDLAPNSYSDVSSWEFGDFVFAWDYDMFADTSKARRYGFHEFIETETMFADIFTDLRKRRIIP